MKLVYYPLRAHSGRPCPFLSTLGEPLDPDGGVMPDDEHGSAGFLRLDHFEQGPVLVADSDAILIARGAEGDAYGAGSREVLGRQRGSAVPVGVAKFRQPPGRRCARDRFEHYDTPRVGCAPEGCT